MKIDLDDLERKAKAATPGPWEADYGAAAISGPNGFAIYDEGGHSEEDAAFIVAARNSFLALIDRIRLLEAALKPFKEAAEFWCDIGLTDNATGEVKVGDLRLASAALEDEL